MGFFGWNPPEDHFLGFKPRYSAWTEDFERFKAMNPDGVRFEIEADGVKQMEELLRLCKDQGIKVAPGLFAGVPGNADIDYEPRSSL